MSEGIEVVGFPSYTVTEDGDIFSHLSGKPRRLTPVLVPNGYHHVTLRGEDGSKQLLVHRVVAEAFVANPDGLPHVNHKNGVKTDNKAINLEWCTQSQNVKHGYDTGLRTINTEHKLRAAALGTAKRKLSVAQADEIRKAYRGVRGDITRLSKAYGIDRKGIHSIVTGKAYIAEGV